jgi:hypothetical protein
VLTTDAAAPADLEHRHMSNPLHTFTPVGTALAVAALATAPAAIAAPLTMDAARAEVRATAKMSVRAGDAAAFAIERCARRSPRRVTCRVRFRDVRRAGRNCAVTFTVTLRDRNYATRPSIPVCRG